MVVTLIAVYAMGARKHGLPVNLIGATALLVLCLHLLF